MKTYNVLSKLFTDKVKNLIKEGKSIDEAFEEVKMSIFGWDLSPTPTPEPTIPPTTPPPTTPPPTTPPPIDVNELTQGDGEENGYRYVDLGLSVKWATCNVGGTLASDEGLLFQFGRTDGYAYNDTNHQFRTKEQNEQDTGSEYIPKTASGKTYNEGDILDPDDDAAHVNMGGSWRMPKESDFIELLENTKHDVVTVNGVKGMLFTSKKNGKWLFVPFAGYWVSESFHDLGSYGGVWSSQVPLFAGSSAFKLACYFNGDAIYNSHYRTHAYSVRGVF